MRGDLAGQTFGRLTVQGRVGVDSHGRNSIWLCRCECGTEVRARADHLRSGRMRSCGCLRVEVTQRTKTKHGHARQNEPRHPLYHTWAHMVERCHDPRRAGYQWYGARGIKVCERWRRDFTAFLADMGPRPSPKHSLDRINNDGDYEPGNVRWATAKEQRANQRAPARVH